MNVVCWFAFISFLPRSGINQFKRKSFFELLKEQGSERSEASQPIHQLRGSAAQQLIELAWWRLTARMVIRLGPRSLLAALVSFI